MPTEEGIPKVITPPGTLPEDQPKPIAISAPVYYTDPAKMQLTSDSVEYGTGTVTFKKTEGGQLEVTRSGGFVNLERGDAPKRVYEGPVVYDIVQNGHVSGRVTVTGDASVSVPSGADIEIFYNKLYTAPVMPTAEELTWRKTTSEGTSHYVAPEQITQQPTPPPPEDLKYVYTNPSGAVITSSTKPANWENLVGEKVIDIIPKITIPETPTFDTTTSKGMTDYIGSKVDEYNIANKSNFIPSTGKSTLEGYQFTDASGQKLNLVPEGYTPPAKEAVTLPVVDINKVISASSIPAMSSDIGASTVVVSDYITPVKNVKQLGELLTETKTITANIAGYTPSTPSLDELVTTKTPDYSIATVVPSMWVEPVKTNPLSEFSPEVAAAAESAYSNMTPTQLLGTQVEIALENPLSAIGLIGSKDIETGRKDLILHNIGEKISGERTLMSSAGEVFTTGVGSVAVSGAAGAAIGAIGGTIAFKAPAIAEALSNTGVGKFIASNTPSIVSSGASKIASFTAKAKDFILSPAGTAVGVGLIAGTEGYKVEELIRTGTSPIEAVASAGLDIANLGAFGAGLSSGIKAVTPSGPTRYVEALNIEKSGSTADIESFAVAKTPTGKNFVIESSGKATLSEGENAAAISQIEQNIFKASKGSVSNAANFDEFPKMEFSGGKKVGSASIDSVSKPVDIAPFNQERPGLLADDITLQRSVSVITKNPKTVETLEYSYAPREGIQLGDSNMLTIKAEGGVAKEVKELSYVKTVKGDKSVAIGQSFVKNTDEGFLAYSGSIEGKTPETMKPGAVGLTRAKVTDVTGDLGDAIKGLGSKSSTSSGTSSGLKIEQLLKDYEPVVKPPAKPITTNKAVSGVVESIRASTQDAVKGIAVAESASLAKTGAALTKTITFAKGVSTAASAISETKSSVSSGIAAAPRAKDSVAVSLNAPSEIGELKIGGLADTNTFESYVKTIQKYGESTTDTTKAAISFPSPKVEQPKKIAVLEEETQWLTTPPGYDTPNNAPSFIDQPYAPSQSYAPTAPSYIDTIKIPYQAPSGVSDFNVQIPQASVGEVSDFTYNPPATSTFLQQSTEQSSSSISSLLSGSASDYSQRSSEIIMPKFTDLTREDQIIIPKSIQGSDYSQIQAQRFDIPIPVPPRQTPFILPPMGGRMRASDIYGPRYGTRVRYPKGRRQRGFSLPKIGGKELTVGLPDVVSTVLMSPRSRRVIPLGRKIFAGSIGGKGYGGGKSFGGNMKVKGVTGNYGVKSRKARF